MTRPVISSISPFFIVRDVSTALSFYRDKLDFSRDFEERFCFETPFTIGVNGLSTSTALPLVTYTPPLQMHPCSSPWLTPFKSKPK